MLARRAKILICCSLVKSSRVTNQTVYDEYRNSRENALADANWPAIPDPAAPDFLTDVEYFWRQRYYIRLFHLQYDLADTAARDLLIARNRAHNSRYTTLPDLPAEQITLAEKCLGPMDFTNFLDAPKYGPSLISLWEDAAKQGLSQHEIARYIYDWARARPEAWNRDDQRKARRQPRVDPELGRRMSELTAWSRTTNPDIPWDAQVRRGHWQVRLNDFPDAYMYTLLIDGQAVGDFNDWPPAWDRGEANLRAALAADATPQVSVKVGAEALLTRYRDGKCEAVWRDLVALGPEVRNKSYQGPAWAIAQETVRRVGRNIDLIVKRLQKLDYHFPHPQYVRVPCSVEDHKQIADWERQGLSIPLSLRAFMEQIGWVDLIGFHPRLNPVDGASKHPQFTDPLQIVGLGESGDIQWVYERWTGSGPGEREPVDWEMGCDAKAKADVLMNQHPGTFYSIEVPNLAADAPLEGDGLNMMFVEYLRSSLLRWGGFPGWERYLGRPEKELAFLRDGLQPF
jgi:hypothetical protein